MIEDDDLFSLLVDVKKFLQLRMGEIKPRDLIKNAHDVSDDLGYRSSLFLRHEHGFKERREDLGTELTIAAVHFLRQERDRIPYFIRMR